jgi:cholesterol transport system auxiliary component
VTKLRTIAAGAVLTLSLGLGGCISLFPKAPPVQTYQFGAAAAAMPASSPPSAAGSFNVLRGQTGFNRAAQGDTILTTTGEETAYIGGARWTTPAVVMFDQAVDDAFSAAGGPVRLISRGDMASATLYLKLDVESFEARYSGGKDAAPIVAVRVHAVLLRLADRHVVSDQTFESHKPAADNRVGAIVGAFNLATNEVLGQLVNWTASAGATALTGAAR